MKNLFYDLPSEIQSYIYEWDDTYRILFKKVLKDIRRYTVYQYNHNENIFLVFDKWLKIYWKTNSLENPHWIICYHYPPIDFLQRKLDFQLIQEIDYVGKGFILPYNDLVSQQYSRQTGGNFIFL